LLKNPPKKFYKRIRQQGEENDHILVKQNYIRRINNRQPKLNWKLYRPKCCIAIVIGTLNRDKRKPSIQDSKRHRLFSI
jgi:hypothetical protein